MATAVGHRIVFGGTEHIEPSLVDPSLLSDLQALIPFAPLHLPETSSYPYRARYSEPCRFLRSEMGEGDGQRICRV